MAIFTAIGSAVTAALGGTAFATFVGGATAFMLQTAAGVALSYFGSMLSGKSDKVAENGVRLSLTAGGDVPRSFMDGLGATAGSLVYANEWGSEGETPNAYSVQVIALADLPSKGLAGVWVNDSPGTFGTAHSTYGSPVLEFRDDAGNDHLWIKFYDGSQTAADSYLVNTVSSAERPYASSRVGYGITHAIVTSLLDDELLSSIPKVRFVLDGCRWYDPSKDSTVGGSGAQREDDPATWGGDGDYLPAVQIINKMRGIRFGGDWFYGLQNTASAQLPVADWIAQINKCRAEIAGPDGNEPTYRSGGEVLVSTQVSDAISADLTACNGRMAEAGGIYKLRFGEPDDPAVAFEDGHIISTEGQTFAPFFKLMESISGVTATFPNPASGYNPKVAPILLRSDVEARLGNRRQLANVSLTKVPYPAQVQRLIKWAMAEGLRERRHVLTMGPEFGILEPGDIVEWSSVRNGYVDKQFRVDGVSIQPNLDVLIEITETDPDDYDWDQETDFRVPVDGPVIRVRPTPQEVSGFSVSPVAGTIAYDAFWSAPSVAVDVDFVRIAHRKLGETDIAWSGVVSRPDIYTGSGRVSQGLQPAQTYEVQIQYLSGSGRPTVASEWLEVTIADVRLSVQDLDDQMRQLTGVLPGGGSLLERFLLLQDELADLANADTGNTVMFDVQLGEARAYFLEQISLVVDDTQAAVDLTTLLLAQFGENIAVAAERLSVVANEFYSQATYAQEVAVEVGGVTASAFRTAVVRASEIDGYDIEVADMLRGTIGGETHEMGRLMLLNSMTGQRAIVDKASEYYLISDDHGVVVNPWSVEDGIVYLVDVRISGSLIVDETITTNLMLANAVFGNVSATQTSTVAAGSEIVSLDMDVLYGSVTVRFTGIQARPTESSTNFGSFRLRLLDNGSVIKQLTYFYDDNYTSSLPIEVTVSVSPGLHTFSADTVVLSGNGWFDIYSGGELTAGNNKR